MQCWCMLCLHEPNQPQNPKNRRLRGQVSNELWNHSRAALTVRFPYESDALNKCLSTNRIDRNAFHKAKSVVILKKLKRQLSTLMGGLTTFSSHVRTASSDCITASYSTEGGHSLIMDDQ